MLDWLDFGWKPVEIPRWCDVELQMVFSFCMDALKHPNSGLWFLEYTGWYVKMVEKNGEKMAM